MKQALACLCFLASVLSVLSFSVGHGSGSRVFRKSEQTRHLSMGSKYAELEKCLMKEYASFFSPMERRFYAEDVTFVDPLTSFTGIDKYQNNVDMLAGRTTLGKVLFSDASIALHNITPVGDSGDQLQTRWTLQVTVSFLPWKPRAKFTGVSVYVLLCCYYCCCYYCIGPLTHPD